MTDPSDSIEGTAHGDARHEEQPRRIDHRRVGRLKGVATGLGVLAGGVAFGGYFTGFFSRSSSPLSSASSHWFDLVPILIGVSVLALAYPRVGFVASGLPLASLGIVIGIRGFVARATSVRFGYGPGFWMIAIGCSALAAAWLVVMVVVYCQGSTTSRLE